MRRAALFLIFALTLTTLACNLASPYVQSGADARL